jgi:hypothetical protein
VNGGSFQLPSGRVVELSARRGGAARVRGAKAPLFSEVAALVRSGELELSDGEAPIEPASLLLPDFHAVRAIATKMGLLAEETIEIECRNCEATIRIAPCAAMELGPFVDRELRDPELDRTLELGVAHAIPEVHIAGRTARSVTFEARTAGEAEPLFRALRRRRFVVSPRVVRAMGVVAMGDERDAGPIARALAACSDEAWDAVTDLYLEASYPPRLFAIAPCPACGARNDVDAPFEREFVAGLSAIPRGSNEDSSAVPFVSREDFARAADELARELQGPGAADVAFLVEDGVPACDEGGEPLLGSYVPAFEGDARSPSHPPEITVYYRTFRAMWTEDGRYDWHAELRETLEHELEHHHAHGRGHDPMDEAERREIDDEAARIVGERAALRGGVSALPVDFAGFVRKTWPIWVAILVATSIAILAAQGR